MIWQHSSTNWRQQMSEPQLYYDQDGIQLWLGDCRDVLPRLPAGSVDLIVTDPPYAISVPGMVHVGQNGSGVRNFDFFAGDDDWAATIQLVVDALRLGLPLLSPRGSIYIWLSHREFGHVVALLEEAGWQTRFLVWAKTNPAPPPPGSGWPSGAELAVYAYRRGRIWNYRGANTPRSNVLSADSYHHGKPGKVAHPTQKPFGVVIPLIRASSYPNSIILDPFAGSGTTLVAARREGRRAIGIEIEERYCAIAADRLRQEEPVRATVD